MRQRYYYNEELETLGRVSRSGSRYYVFENGEWVRSEMSFGEDYREISEDRAHEIMGCQLADHVIDKCTEEYLKDEWDYVPGWERRVATTDFVFKGCENGINFIKDCLECESFEALQDSIEAELRRLGATDIVSTGYTEDRTDEDVSSICDEFVDHLIERWTQVFREEKEEWDKNPGWEAKNVKTVFRMNRNRYTIYPETIGLDRTGWDAGFMETIQKDIEEDLNYYGIRCVDHYGDID